MSIEQPDIKQWTTARFAEHEVLFSFINDADAERFIEWWNTKGWAAFKKSQEKKS